ncbi:hypothetical protein T4E_12209 [Trichinella pseudospiralis]|uniref:Uncharacterized protein n=1 Tax=Trichinella pseudospiralis TaxID=6337 RepID=A0A0V0WJK3_TRIPS|nr:hypothetical protein T4E_12209 [Trichinella pseudospiralis]
MGNTKTQELCRILQKRLKSCKDNNVSILEHRGVIYNDPRSALDPKFPNDHNITWTDVRSSDIIYASPTTTQHS